MRNPLIERWLPVVSLTLLWAAMHGFVLVVGGSLDGDLVGTDPYMRLVRTGELLDGEGWFDQVIDRSNAPFGDELHWTRPLDLLLIVMAAPLAPFVGFHDALFSAGVAVSPLVHLAAAFAVNWAGTPWLGAKRARLASIVFLGQVVVFLQVLPGQADHHSLQLLVLIVELGLLLRIFDSTDRSHSSRLALLGGAVAGVGIWISAETTIVAALAVSALGIAWLRQIVPAATLRRYAVGMIAIVVLAIITERTPTGWLDVEYDKVSLPHLAAGLSVLAVAISLAWIERRAMPPRSRAGFALLAAGLPAAVLLLAFPGLLLGPTADADPRLGPLWIDFISELQPLFPTDLRALGWLLVAIGQALVALPVALALTWRTRHAKEWASWMTLTLFVVGYVGLALWHVRFAPFASVPLALIGADILGRSRDWAAGLRWLLLRRVAWPVTAPLFVVGFTVGGALIISASTNGRVEASEVPRCDLRAVAHALEQQPGASGAIVVAHIDHGPELLYRTDAAIVAGPYHRNAAGILDVFDFFSATDTDESRRIAEARDARFVLFCDTRTEAILFAGGKSAPSLYERLVSDDPPEWLSLTMRGTEEQRFRLYELQGE